MSARIFSLNRIAIAAAGLTFAALLTGGAHAITDTVFKYSTPKTGFFNIPDTALTVSGPSSSFIVSNLGTGPTANTPVCFLAPVNLPQGAKMTELRVWYSKGNGSSFLVELLRRTSQNGAYDYVVANQDLPDTNGAYSVKVLAISDVASQLVNNALYSYGVQTCMNNASNVYYNGRIAYTYTTAGD